MVRTMSVHRSESSSISYRRFTEKRVAIGIVFLLLLIVFSILAVGVGTYSLSPAEVLKSFVDRSTKASLVIWNIRFPRIIASIMVGAGLAISGSVMQCLLRNPLASPFTMGISHGAMFGASFAIGVLGAGSAESTGKIFISNPYTVVIFAFAGAIFGMLIILNMSKLKGLSPGAMILAGVAMSSLFTAATTLIQYFATEERLAAMVYWTFGDLGRAVWKEVLIIILVLIPSLVYFYLKRWDYNAMESGDETAKTLGVNPIRTRLLGTFLASLITAVSVSFVGK
jgi:iron complex transport system permease protein